MLYRSMYVNEIKSGFDIFIQRFMGRRILKYGLILWMSSRVGLTTLEGR